MDYGWIITAVMGGLIGLITNGIAIKMLFRPLYPVKIGNWTVPFTPGIIPKEKNRIAKSLGKVVSSELLNYQVVANALRSQLIQDKLVGIVDKIVEKGLSSDKTIEEELQSLLSQEVAAKAIHALKRDASKLIESQLTNFEFGQDIVKEALTRHYEQDKSLVGKIMDEKMIASLSESLGKRLNKVISTNADTIVNKLVNEEGDALLSIKVSDVMTRYQSKVPTLQALLLVKYNQILDDDLPKILSTLDIAKIVEDRINSYDMAQLEKLILSIINKELNAIVILGGVLGVIMGLINGLLL